MRNQIIGGAFLCMVLILGLVFVVAERNNDFGNKKIDMNETKKMNYGLCVSNETKAKNVCFKESKEIFKSCSEDIKDNVKNETFTNKTEIKDMKSLCRESFKSSMNLCKEDFKVKKYECQRYKCEMNQTFFNGTCLYS